MSALALRQYALDHYNEGGHWVYETTELSDLEQILKDAGNNLTKAKASVKEQWEFMNELERECRFE